LKSASSIISAMVLIPYNYGVITILAPVRTVENNGPRRYSRRIIIVKTLEIDGEAKMALMEVALP
jgi:hypothetical protein